jgi:thiamine transporter
MIAMATVLSYIPLFQMPQGGSITLCSMTPLVLVSLRHGVRWGVLTGTVFGILQTFLGIQNVLYCTTIWTMIGCVLLDYIIAYAVMGATCLVAGGFKHRAVGVAVGTAATGLLRYGCSFLSGILIWGAYAPEDMPVWIYSLTYNGSYMLPEIAVTVISAVIIVRILEKRANSKPTNQKA